jgi:two-component system sensor histidine kinase AgrC
VNREKTAVIEYVEHLQKILNSNRASFHDFRHHLNIINSFNITSEGEILNIDQDEYIKSLVDSGKMGGTSIVKDDVLISAMLHQKSELAKQKNISFTVSIASTLSAYPIPRSDLTDMLINLVNNAFDAVENMDAENRVVNLNFFDKYIEVGNKVSLSFMKNDMGNTDLFFKQGYSTKGAERGFGLSNVLSIVEKYGMKISSKVENSFFIQEVEFPA